MLVSLSRLGSTGRTTLAGKDLTLKDHIIKITDGVPKKDQKFILDGNCVINYQGLMQLAFKPKKYKLLVSGDIELIDADEFLFKQSKDSKKKDTGSVIPEPVKEEIK